MHSFTGELRCPHISIIFDLIITGGIAMVEYWHMQLHSAENDKKKREEQTQKAIENEVIGLDLSPEITPEDLIDKPLNQWSDDDFTRCKEKHKVALNKESVTAVLSDFLKLKKGDIVLIRSGKSPKAIVEIIGEYFFGTKQDVWFRHCFPVRILGTYEGWIRDSPQNAFTPPAQGTLQKLNPSNQAITYVKMVKWLNDIKMEERMQSIFDLLRFNKQLILTGPPGIGKTYTAKKLVKEMLGT
jgi:hypothetical protein